MSKLIAQPVTCGPSGFHCMDAKEKNLIELSKREGLDINIQSRDQSVVTDKHEFENGDTFISKKSQAFPVHQNCNARNKNKNFQSSVPEKLKKTGGRL